MSLTSAADSTLSSTLQEAVMPFQSSYHQPIERLTDSHDSSSIILKFVSDTVSPSTYRLHEAEISEPQTSSIAPARPPARIPYETGFGDFCFGRWMERNDDLVGRVDPAKYQSHSVKFEDLDGFIR